VLEIVAQRSGGNPQFLRDLLHSACNPADGLPDSAESRRWRASTLAPGPGAVRRAVLGLTFHPRMMAWLAAEDDAPPPDTTTWARLHQLFDVESDGYIRFRRSLLRDAAYEGLPFKLRRRLHVQSRRISRRRRRSAEVSGIRCTTLSPGIIGWPGGMPPPGRAEGSTRCRRHGCTRALTRGAASDVVLGACGATGPGDAWNWATEFRKRPTRTRPPADWSRDPLRR
jgi:hypothetical protein